MQDHKTTVVVSIKLVHTYTYVHTAQTLIHIHEFVNNLCLAHRPYRRRHRHQNYPYTHH